jgi:hypothetical protein
MWGEARAGDGSGCRGRHCGGQGSILSCDCHSGSDLVESSEVRPSLTLALSIDTDGARDVHDG